MSVSHLLRANQQSMSDTQHEPGAQHEMTRYLGENYCKCWLSLNICLCQKVSVGVAGAKPGANPRA